MVQHLFDGWVTGACQLFDDTGWVADATFVRSFDKRLCSCAIRSKNLAHAQPNPHEMLQHHPAFHDSAFPKKKLGKRYNVEDDFHVITAHTDSPPASN